MSGVSADRGLVVTQALEPGARAVVLGAAALGVPVIFAVPAGAEAAAGELVRDARSSGARAEVSFVIGDVAREDDVERIFDVAADRIESIGAVAAFAGAHRSAKLLDLATADWEAALARYLRGPFLIARRAVEEFLGVGDGGRIVFVAPQPTRGGALLQSTTTEALLGFARSVAKEVGRRQIACNVVVPPPLPYAGEARVGAEALAETVLFLLGDASSFISGVALNSDLRYSAESS